MNTLVSMENTGILPFLEHGKSLAIAHKLGGDNMGLLAANTQVMQLLSEAGVTQNFSVSAFRSSRQDFNTTSKLITAGESKKSSEIESALGEIAQFHQDLLHDILSEETSEIRNTLLLYTQELFEAYIASLSGSNLKASMQLNDYSIGVGERVFSLLALGEVIAAKVLAKYCELKGIPAVYVDTSKLCNISLRDIHSPVENFFQEHFQRLYRENSGIIPIIPGYIGGIEGGILGKIGRGYTDFTASRSAVALARMKQFDTVILYIQKLYGFKSTDPRILGDAHHRAKSVNHLSYALTRRAISKRGAGAGLINSYSLDEGITKNDISLLVGNPTDSSDIAHIDQHGDRFSQSVNLVLGRDSHEQDALRFGTQHQLQAEGEQRHIVYLMGENIENIALVYQQARKVLQKNGITELAGELMGHPYKELSFLFSDKQTAQKAQDVLHDYFIERNT